MAGSFVDCKLPGHQQLTRVRGEEAAGVGADSGFSGTSNAMLEKKSSHMVMGSKHVMLVGLTVS